MGLKTLLGGGEGKQMGRNSRERLARYYKTMTAPNYYVTPSGGLLLWADSRTIQRHFLKKLLVNSKGCKTNSPLCSLKTLSHSSLSYYGHIQNYVSIKGNLEIVVY